MGFTRTRRLDVHLQHEIVTDLGRVDLLTGAGDDLHQTRRRRSGVRYRASRGQHGHVKAQRDVLLSRIVNAPYVIGLSFVRDQFRMFLYDQHETGFALCARAEKEKIIIIITIIFLTSSVLNSIRRILLCFHTHVDVYESAVTEVHFEYFGLGRRVLRHRHDPPTTFVFAMAFHVQHSVESFFRY